MRKRCICHMTGIIYLDVGPPLVCMHVWTRPPTADTLPVLQVMVELGGGFKMGVVKYIGETEFAPGEWIGVAFDKPFGEC